MTDRPIIMTGESVRAILQGTKTQTRRVMKPQASHDARWCAPGTLDGDTIDAYFLHPDSWTAWESYAVGDYGGPPYETTIDLAIRCPYGVAGDKLYVKETWAHDCPHCDDPQCGNSDHIWYRASEAPIVAESFAGSARWRSSMFMPRWASRLTLEIVKVKVERLQDISDGDAIAEGVPDFSSPKLSPYMAMGVRAWYSDLWDSLNAKRGYPWAASPWIWAIEFKKVNNG